MSTLVVSKEQVRSVDESYLDVFVSHVIEFVNKEIPAQEQQKFQLNDPVEVHIRKAALIARKYGITAQNSTCYFVLLTMLHGLQFLERPEFKADLFYISAGAFDPNDYIFQID